MRAWARTTFVISALIVAAAVCVTTYIALPTNNTLELSPPLQKASFDIPVGLYSADYASLRGAFRPQTFRSYCGPASIATVLAALGKPIEQTDLFPSIGQAMNVFFSGMSLTELEQLAIYQGLKTERVHANALSLDQFRARLRTNLATPGDYVLVNYDRRVLKQEGAGHISPLAAYDARLDRVLILDEAAYKYPFTWVPTPLLYSAMHTDSGEGWRGLLFIYEIDSASSPSNPQ